MKYYYYYVSTGEIAGYASSYGLAWIIVTRSRGRLFMYE